MEDLHLEHVAVNGVTLHLAEAGPADGRLVILLHGFPEYWAAWLQYIEVLAAADYHVIAPDQRGYNLSDKPAEVSGYDLDALAADVIGLADHFGCYRFTVKPRSIGCGLLQIPAGTSSKIRSPHPKRRQVRDERLILRSLRIKRSACEHYDLNAGVVLRSTSRNNPGGRFIGVYDCIAVVARCLWREAESRL
jgi:hypothetical protein